MMYSSVMAPYLPAPPAWLYIGQNATTTQIAITDGRVP